MPTVDVVGHAFARHMVDETDLGGMESHDHVDVGPRIGPADHIDQPLAHRWECDVPSLNRAVPHDVEEDGHELTVIAKTEILANPVVVRDAIRPEVVESSPTTHTL